MALARPLRPALEGEINKRLIGLRRAVEAAEAGKPLWRGELLEDLPAALRRWASG